MKLIGFTKSFNLFCEGFLFALMLKSDRILSCFKQARLGVKILSLLVAHIEKTSDLVNNYILWLQVLETGCSQSRSSPRKECWLKQNGQNANIYVVIANYLYSKHIDLTSTLLIMQTRL